MPFYLFFYSIYRGRCFELQLFDLFIQLDGLVDQSVLFRFFHDPLQAIISLYNFGRRNRKVYPYLPKLIGRWSLLSHISAALWLICCCCFFSVFFFFFFFCNFGRLKFFVLNKFIQDMSANDSVTSSLQQIWFDIGE